MSVTRPLFSLAFLLIGGLASAPGQGLLAIQERATLVVEARIHQEHERVRAEVRRVWKGPAALSRLDLFLPDRISAHARPRPGSWYLLHLVPLVTHNRVWVPLQRPLAVLPMDAGSESAPLADQATRLAANTHDRVTLAAVLFEALESSWPTLVDMAAQDLLARPDLLSLAPSTAGSRLLARLEELPPGSAPTIGLTHLVGALSPRGWEERLADLLTRPDYAPLAPVVGAVLTAHLAGEAVELLARKASIPPQPGLLLALGATRRPEALPLLAQELSRPEGASLASRALLLHGSRQACEILADALAACPQADQAQAQILIDTLGRIPTSHARRILSDVAEGRRALAHSARARKALGR